MNKILKISKREYLAAVKTKGFVIGLVVMPFLMFGGMIAMAALKGRVDTKDKEIAIIDRSGLVSTGLVQAAKQRNDAETINKKTGDKLRPAYFFKIVAPEEKNLESQRLALSDQIRQGKLHAFIEVGPKVAHPPEDPALATINYHAKNPALDEIRRWCGGPINDLLRKARLTQAGVDPASVKDLFDYRSVDGMDLVTKDAKTGAIQAAKPQSEAQAVLLPIFVTLIMFMMGLMGATPLLNSVMEEKSQRIAEVLLGSVRPFDFMFGKILGGVGVSLTGSTVYVVAGLFAISTMGMAGVIQPEIIVWFFIYMLTNAFMLGALFAAVGSLCNDPKEAQSLTLPAMMPIMIPMFILGPVLEHPTSPFATSMSLIPPFTPILMLLRMSTPGGVPAWQPWVGLLGVLICTILVIWIGGRVFRIGILLQGKTPKFGEILGWMVRG